MKIVYSVTQYFIGKIKMLSYQIIRFQSIAYIAVTMFIYIIY